MRFIDDATRRAPPNTLLSDPNSDRIGDDPTDLPHTEACGRPRLPDNPAGRLTHGRIMRRTRGGG